MEKEKEITEEYMKCILKQYLEQYIKKRKRKLILQKRLEQFEEEMLGPKAISYSLTPKSRTNNLQNEPADFYIHYEEIEERINAERKAAASSMIKVFDILNFLRPDSEEKNILEYKYLDGYSWEKIALESSMSKSRCIDYWNKGLDELLQFKKVQSVLNEYDKTYLIYNANKNMNPAEAKT